MKNESQINLRITEIARWIIQNNEERIKAEKENKPHTAQVCFEHGRYFMGLRDALEWVLRDL